MSDASISFIKGLYECFARGDIGGVVAGMADDVRWRLNGQQSDYPLFAPRNGAQAVKQFFADLATMQKFSEFVPQDFYASGDKVFVLGRYAGTILKTGRPFASEFIHMFTMRGGKVSEFIEFTDTARFVEASRQ